LADQVRESGRRDLTIRGGGTGEHVVWLRPQLDGDRVKPQATITVWSQRPSPLEGSHWRQASDPLEVFYGRGAGEGGGVHAGD